MTIELKPVVETAAEIRFSRNVPANILKASVFKPNGNPPDPAGLCDGGDWIEEVQIRIEPDGQVYISIKPWERSEWWSGTISWSRFHSMMLVAVKATPEIKHHDH